MKKSLVALAVLAASGAAMAQSSVTLFGIVDAAYTKGSGSVSNKQQLTNSGYNSSRLGFRGVEDLGEKDYSRTENDGEPFTGADLKEETRDGDEHGDDRDRDRHRCREIDVHAVEPARLATPSHQENG